MKRRSVKETAKWMGAANNNKYPRITEGDGAASSPICKANAIHYSKTQFWKRKITS